MKLVIENLLNIKSLEKQDPYKMWEALKNSSFDKDELKEWKHYLKLAYLNKYIKGAQKNIFESLVFSDTSLLATNYSKLNKIIDNVVVEGDRYQKIHNSKTNFKELENMFFESSKLFFWNVEDKNTMVYEKLFFEDMKKKEIQINKSLSEKKDVIYYSSEIDSILNLWKKNSVQFSSTTGVLLNNRNTKEEKFLLERERKRCQTQALSFFIAYFFVLKLVEDNKIEEWIKNNGRKDFSLSNRIDINGTNIPGNQEVKISFLKKTKIFGWENLFKDYTQTFIKEEIWKHKISTK